MRLFTQSFRDIIMVGVCFGGVAIQSPGAMAEPQPLTLAVLHKIAAGQVVATDLVPRGEGYLEIDLFEGPADEVVTPKPRRICGAELDYALKALPERAEDAIEPLTYDPQIPPAPRGIPEALWQQLRWVHYITPAFLLTDACAPEFGGIACRTGGEMEWSPVQRFVFTYNETGALQLKAIVTIDEALVTEEAVEADLRKAGAAIKRLAKTKCADELESAARLNDIGITARRADDSDKARHFYTLALGKDPKFDLAAYNLACEYARIDEQGDALKMLRFLESLQTPKGKKFLKDAPKDENFADMLDNPDFKALTK